MNWEKIIAMKSLDELKRIAQRHRDDLGKHLSDVDRVGIENRIDITAQFCDAFGPDTCLRLIGAVEYARPLLSDFGQFELNKILEAPNEAGTGSEEA